MAIRIVPQTVHQEAIKWSPKLNTKASWVHIRGEINPNSCPLSLWNCRSFWKVGSALLNCPPIHSWESFTPRNNCWYSAMCSDLGRLGKKRKEHKTQWQNWIFSLLGIWNGEPQSLYMANLTCLDLMRVFREQQQYLCWQAYVVHKRCYCTLKGGGL